MTARERPQASRIIPERKWVFELFDRLRGPRLLAFLYVVGSTVYAVLAFRNFSAPEVVAAVFLFSALPMGLILLSGNRVVAKGFRPSWRSVVLALVGAPVMFFIQFSGLSRWAPYFSNFPNHRMEFGEPGFHQDSVFHVAIIQGVLNTGYPTTGQHLEPWVSYHTLSHYVDVLGLFFLGLDPWESYALLFFAKGVALSLAVIYFSMKVGENRSESIFWLTLLVVYPAFTATWHVIGSHGQWLPMIILPLAAHRVFVIGMKETRTWADYSLLTALVIFFALGKASIGFTFAVFVGLWLFFRRPVDWRLLATGGAWVVFLGMYSIVFSARASTELDLSALWNRFAPAWRDIFALVIIAVLVAVVARMRPTRFAGALSAAVFATIFVTSITVVAITSNRDDLFYFFHGLFSVVLFLSVAMVAHVLLSRNGNEGVIGTSASRALTLLAFAGSLLFVVSPVSSKSAVSPYSSLETMWTLASTVSNHTYIWSNEGAGPGQSLTAWQALQGKDLRAEAPDGKPWASRFRDSLHEFVEVSQLSSDSPVLFLTAEQLDTVSVQISSPRGWASGLAVTAVTGMPLVYGVSDPGFPAYGFADYGEDSRMIYQRDVTEEELCRFGRPVIISMDSQVLSFDVICRD